MIGITGTLRVQRILGRKQSDSFQLSIEQPGCDGHRTGRPAHRRPQAAGATLDERRGRATRLSAKLRVGVHKATNGQRTDPSLARRTAFWYFTPDGGNARWALRETADVITG